VKAKTAEKWAWILIYSGLLMLCLGLFVLRSAALPGWLLLTAGTLDAIAGVALIYWRSRWPESTTAKDTP
jgi:protein-S-isoprenylcysteine O-methyltransferase Ste14